MRLIGINGGSTTTQTSIVSADTAAAAAAAAAAMFLTDFVDVAASGLHDNETLFFSQDISLSSSSSLTNFADLRHAVQPSRVSASGSRHSRAESAQETALVAAVYDVIDVDIGLQDDILMPELESVASIAGNVSSDESLNVWTPAVVFRVATISVLMALTLLGNASLIAVIAGQPSLRRKRVSVFLLNLAVGDLMVCFVTMTTEILFVAFGQWVLGAIACKLIVYGQIVTLASTTFLLTAMSIDRYQVLVQPLKSLGGTRQVWRKVFVSWLLALIFAVPQLFVFVQKEAHTVISPHVNAATSTTPSSATGWYTSADDDDDDVVEPTSSSKVMTTSYECRSAGYTAEWQRKVYFSFMTTYILVVPTSIMTYCYSGIIRVVWLRASGSTATLDGATGAVRSNPVDIDAPRIHFVTARKRQRSSEEPSPMMIACGSACRCRQLQMRTNAIGGGGGGGGNASSGGLSPPLNGRRMNGVSAPTGVDCNTAGSVQQQQQQQQTSKQLHRIQQQLLPLQCQTHHHCSNHLHYNYSQQQQPQHQQQQQQRTLSEQVPNCGRTAASSSTKAMGGMPPRMLTVSSKRNVVKMTMSVIVGFVVCWTPYFVVSLIRIYSDYRIQIETLLSISELMALGHSALNPLLYIVYSTRAVRASFQLLRRRHRCCLPDWCRRFTARAACCCDRSSRDRERNQHQRRRCNRASKAPPRHPGIVTPSTSGSEQPPEPAKRLSLSAASATTASGTGKQTYARRGCRLRSILQGCFLTLLRRSKDQRASRGASCNSSRNRQLLQQQQQQPVRGGRVLFASSTANSCGQRLLNGNNAHIRSAQSAPVGSAAASSSTLQQQQHHHYRHQQQPRSSSTASRRAVWSLAGSTSCSAGTVTPRPFSSAEYNAINQTSGSNSSAAQLRRNTPTSLTTTTISCLTSGTGAVGGRWRNTTATCLVTSLTVPAAAQTGSGQRPQSSHGLETEGLRSNWSSSSAAAAERGCHSAN